MRICEGPRREYPDDAVITIIALVVCMVCAVLLLAFYVPYSNAETAAVLTTTEREDLFDEEEIFDDLDGLFLEYRMFCELLATDRQSAIDNLATALHTQLGYTESEALAARDYLSQMTDEEAVMFAYMLLHLTELAEEWLD